MHTGVEILLSDPPVFPTTSSWLCCAKGCATLRLSAVAYTNKQLASTSPHKLLHACSKLEIGRCRTTTYPLCPVQPLNPRLTELDSKQRMHNSGAQLASVEKLLFLCFCQSSAPLRMVLSLAPTGCCTGACSGRYLSAFPTPFV